MHSIRGTLSVALVALLLFAAGAAVADGSHAYPVVSYGDRSFVDSLAWSNGQGLGTGGLVDTLVAASLRDTSDAFPLTNLAWLGAMWKTDFKTNVSDAVTCSLEVSMDGTNWVRPAGMAVFSTAASAADGTDWCVFFSNVDIDAPVTANNVSDKAAQAAIGVARLGRFVTATATQTADTLFSQIYVHRQYQRR